MIYITYEEYKNRYYETQQRYNNIINEKEELFLMTQPKAISYDKERVTGGTPVNTFDEYLVKKEEKNIDQRLNEVKSILEDRERLLKIKETELKASIDIQDKVYTLRYIDKLKVCKIAKRLNYSEMQIYRILKTIRKNMDFI